MTPKEELEIYEREVNLILKQNPVECELYSVLATFLRTRKIMNKYSLRDVSSRRRSSIGNKFLTKAGFSDFSVMTLDDIPEMLGVVEIKRLVEKLDNNKKQAELHQYRENDEKRLVEIYTNGLEWRFYLGELGENEKDRIIIGKINNDKVDFEVASWEKLIEFLENIDWTGRKYRIEVSC